MALFYHGAGCQSFMLVKSENPVFITVRGSFRVSYLLYSHLHERDKLLSPLLIHGLWVQTPNYAEIVLFLYGQTGWDGHPCGYTLLKRE